MEPCKEQKGASQRRRKETLDSTGEVCLLDVGRFHRISSREASCRRPTLHRIRGKSSRPNELRTSKIYRHRSRTGRRTCEPCTGRSGSVYSTGGVEAREVVEDCGIGGHDVYSRFRHVTGHGIKEFVVYHRLRLAKRLLRYNSLSVSEIAFAVGYASPSGFSKTFKRHVGSSPTAFRRREEG